jgi:hypothetical protein
VEFRAPTWPTATAADGVVVVRNVLDEAQLADLAAAVDENLAEPGEWAIDYTPAGSTGRFFGDYVNWERIDGYRRAALTGPLPRVGTHVARRDTAGSSMSTPW